MPNRIISKKTVIILVFILTFIILSFFCVSISINPFDNGGCFSVTFDKFPMLIADRVVIRVGDKKFEITDNEMVCEVTSATICATNTDLRYPKTNRWIDIYCGNILIRSMRWEDNHNGIIVYHADIFHWVFPSINGDGLVYPSIDLIEKLEEVINDESNIAQYE